MVTCTVHSPGPYSSDQPQLPQSLHRLVDFEGLSHGHYPFRSNLTLVKSAVGDAHKHTHKHISHYDRYILPWDDTLIRWFNLLHFPYTTVKETYFLQDIKPWVCVKPARTLIVRISIEPKQYCNKPWAWCHTSISRTGRDQWVHSTIHIVQDRRFSIRAEICTCTKDWNTFLSCIVYKPHTWCNLPIVCQRPVYEQCCHDLCYLTGWWQQQGWSHILWI